MHKPDDLIKIQVPSIVWLRRDLRLYDHVPFYHATKEKGFIQPIFIFDPKILERFPNKKDQRLSFLADTLIGLNEELIKKSGSLLIFYGSPVEILPRLTALLKAQKVFASEDFEPENIQRDYLIKQILSQQNVKLITLNDHLLISPKAIVKADGTPYKVFTPYSLSWKQHINLSDYSKYDFDDRKRYLEGNKIIEIIKSAGLNILTETHNSGQLLDLIGYKHQRQSEWHFSKAQGSLGIFMEAKMDDYEKNRNFLVKDGTSKLSPYIRFGLVSIRDCYRRAIKAQHSAAWINELIWRDFYAMILYYFPKTQHENFLDKYNGKLKWPNNQKLLRCFMEAKTGYPVIDAAVRQLITTGWMHNRARMIVASFLTKHLLIDWKIGEEYFSQYLMDYELSSNVGGWQWAASTGTDAQPYFRIFNPSLQGQKFDPDGEYIKSYIPELINVPSKYIHRPFDYDTKIYYKPIVDHKEARAQSVRFFSS